MQTTSEEYLDVLLNIRVCAAAPVPKHSPPIASAALINNVFISSRISPCPCNNRAASHVSYRGLRPSVSLPLSFRAKSRPELARDVTDRWQNLRVIPDLVGNLFYRVPFGMVFLGGGGGNDFDPNVVGVTNAFVFESQIDGFGAFGRDAAATGLCSEGGIIHIIG